MKIAKADLKDIDSIVDIEMSSGYHRKPVKSEIRKLFVNFFNSAHPYAFVLKNRDKPIGYFAFRKARDYCELDYFAIDKEYQGKGLSKLLLSKIVSLSGNTGLGKIKLSVRNSNKRAIDLYKKYGFKAVGKNKNKLYMVKELK